MMKRQHAPDSSGSTSSAREDHTINSKNVVRAAAEAAIEMKATELRVLDVNGLTSFCDWFVLCNGTNSRQIQAIANRMLETLEEDLGVRPLGVEGMNQARWILIDAGDVLIHVFHQDLRGHYDLDGLWIDAPRVTLEDLGIEDIPLEAMGFALP